jgi:hypothetical protein
LLTNDRTLTNTQVLEAHKRQPTIEKRFEQTKTVFEIAPVYTPLKTRCYLPLFDLRLKITEF